MLATLTLEQARTHLSGTPEERARFLREAAREGHADAQAAYGQLLLDGSGVPADAPAALGWFVRAAAQGHLMALNMVGRCYDLGWGTTVDKARAAECYAAAAKAGLDWAMYNYATLLTLGEGVAQDRVAALAWFEKAAALGNAKAINFCGSFAEDGWVAARDMAKAADCYALAAAGGDFRGCFNHARMLLADGRTDEAASWIDQALELGTPRFRGQVTDWLAREAPALHRRAAA